MQVNIEINLTGIQCFIYFLKAKMGLKKYRWKKDIRNLILKGIKFIFYWQLRK